MRQSFTSFNSRTKRRTIEIMDSSKKILRNSSTKINGKNGAAAATTVASTSASSRDSSCHHKQRLNFEQKLSQSEVTNRLKSLSDAINETSAENVALGKEVSNLLSKLEIEPHLLSREARDGLDKVVAILKKEDLAEVNEMALAITMERRKRNDISIVREDRELKKKYEELCSQYASLEEKLHTVQEKVSSLTELVNASKLDEEIDYSEMIHNATKLNDYKKTCDNLDKELADMQLTDDFPEKIISKYKQCMQSTGELAELNSFLSQYGYLPPDILEAKAYLEQQEKRRQEVKNKLDEKLNSFCLKKNEK